MKYIGSVHYHPYCSAHFHPNQIGPTRKPNDGKTASGLFASIPEAATTKVWRHPKCGVVFQRQTFGKK